VGTALSGAGDLDADGFGDEAASGYGNELGGRMRGGVYVLYGPLGGVVGTEDADATVVGSQDLAFLGTDVSPAGDTDGDGAGELWLGEPDDYLADEGAGRVWLVAAPQGSPSLAEDSRAVLHGEAEGEGVGVSVSGGGDLDGDGVPDLLVGAWGQDGGAGGAYAVLGPVSGASDIGDVGLRLGALDGRAGVDVSAGGDVDGDGRGDALVGAYEAAGADGPEAGGAWLTLGPCTGDPAALLLGEAAGDRAGVSVSLAGDLDADGLADLGVGAYRESTAGAEAGATYVFYGPASGSISLASADARFYGAGNGSWSGVSLAAGGDADGDGYGEILVGAPGEAGTGAVRLWEGRGL
jgi:hypothetical protein